MSEIVLDTDDAINEYKANIDKFVADGVAEYVTVVKESGLGPKAKVIGSFDLLMPAGKTYEQWVDNARVLYGDERIRAAVIHVMKVDARPIFVRELKNSTMAETKSFMRYFRFGMTVRRKKSQLEKSAMDYADLSAEDKYHFQIHAGLKPDLAASLTGWEPEEGTAS